MYNLNIDIRNPHKIIVTTDQRGGGTENHSLLNFTYGGFQKKFVDEHKILLGDVSNEALNITITTADMELSEDTISLLRPVIRALNVNVKSTTVNRGKTTDVTKKFLPIIQLRLSLNSDNSITVLDLLSSTNSGIELPPGTDLNGLPDFFSNIDGIAGLTIGILINGDESIEYFQSNQLKGLNELSELVYNLAPIAKKVQVLDCRSLDGPCKQWPDITEDFFPASPKPSWSTSFLSWLSGSNAPDTEEETAARRPGSFCQ